MSHDLKNKVKNFLNKLISKFGYQFISLKDAQYDPVIDNDKVFIDIYEKIAPYTMTTRSQCYALYKAVQYIVKAEINGDFVECGVWRGGNTMLIAYTLLQLGVKDRKIYLYDTYEGMTEPDSRDYDLINTEKKAKKEWEKKQDETNNNWCYASLEDVKNNMSSTNYPTHLFVYVKGKVEDTIPEQKPSDISVLRLDTDWYSSTKHELEHLYPIVSKGGVLIIDDYGTWAGSKKATDEYFSTKPVLLNQIDKQNRLVVKAIN